MTKITTITRANLVALEKDIKDALQAVAEKHGLAMRWKGGQFSPQTFVPKFEFATVDENGTAQSSEVRDFKAYASIFGLQPDDLGKTFKAKGGTFTICGLNMKARARPIMARSDGKMYVFPAETVQKLLQRQA